MCNYLAQILYASFSNQFRRQTPMTSRISALVLRAAYKLLTILQPGRSDHYSSSPEAMLFAGKQPYLPTHLENPLIPKIIWTYWDSDNSDALVDQCFESWRIHNPGFAIHVLNNQNMKRHIPLTDIPAAFLELPPAKRSDWVRLYVVSRHGGYWLDASILLTQSLAWLDVARHEQGAEFSGFHLEGYKKDSRLPVVESWAFGAPANSSFVTAWQKEFHHALIELGTERYLADIQNSNNQSVLQGIADPAYLLIHVTAQQVLRRDNDFTLALFKAEDTAYFYQKTLSWKWYFLYPRLCLISEKHPSAPLIKLRGGERRHFSELFTKHGQPVQGSIWQKACDKLPSRCYINDINNL